MAGREVSSQTAPATHGATCAASFRILLTPFDAYVADRRGQLARARSISTWRRSSASTAFGLAHGQRVSEDDRGGAPARHQDRWWTTCADGYRWWSTPERSPTWWPRCTAGRPRSLGASAVMCMPPSMGRFRHGDALVLQGGLGRGTGAGPAFRTRPMRVVPAGVIRQIAEESEHVRYAKIESAPNPLKVQEAVQQAGRFMTRLRRLGRECTSSRSCGGAGRHDALAEHAGDFHQDLGPAGRPAIRMAPATSSSASCCRCCACRPQACASATPSTRRS